MTAALTHILYVEDEPDIREVGKAALEMIGGFTLKVCGSGSEALEAISGFPAQLVLLDVMMPGLSGPETFSKLKEMTPGKTPPVVFMTAKVQPHETQQYKEMGAIGVVPKPFNPRELPGTVKSLWQAYNERSIG